MDQDQEDVRLEGVLFYQLEQTLRQSIRYTNRLFEHLRVDITKDQWLVLKKVNDDQDQGIAPFELAKVLGKEAASMTRMLDILERKQLLTRQPNPADRRSSLVFPTAKGKAVFRELLPHVKEIRKQVVKGLSETDIARFRTILKTMEENMR